jgi:ankyrin repeat protein
MRAAGKELIVPSRQVPVRTLRQRPDIDQLKRQAKELRAAFRAGEPDAVAEVTAHFRGADPGTFALHDAQLVLARSYGFDSWPKLKARVDGVTVRRLCEAVERGDVASARGMLRLRPELVNYERPDHGEQRAVHIAVLRRDAAMVRLLMGCGADARIGIWPNRDATSALTLAAERGYDDIVRIIREAERRRVAERTDGTGSGGSPAIDALCEAIAEGDDARAIAMGEADPALIHSAQGDGWTALHVAAARLNVPMATWLLDRGANVNQPGKDGWTPLDVAASGVGWGPSGSAERFSALAEVLRARGAELAPVSAVALGDTGWLRTRHDHRVLTTATRLRLFDPFDGLLTVAVTHDRPDVLALLLDCGLDPDERVRVEGTEEPCYSWGLPLYTCARHGKPDMARMLLERGADPNGLVYASGSPIFAAHDRQDASMIELLEQYGGAIDAASVGYLRQPELARKMLAGEADARLASGTFSGDQVAEQILWSGASGGDVEIVRMALERVDWPREDQRWFWMLWRPLPGHSPRPHDERARFHECFRLVLERCDPDVRSEFGQTMLHEVVARDHGEGLAFALLLLDAGARLDTRDHLLQSTPLGWACRWGRLELVKLLLERGADPVEADAEPWAAPRAWAVKMGHATVTRVLADATSPSSPRT